MTPRSPAVPRAVRSAEEMTPPRGRRLGRRRRALPPGRSGESDNAEYQIALERAMISASLGPPRRRARRSKRADSSRTRCASIRRASEFDPPNRQIAAKVARDRAHDPRSRSRRAAPNARSAAPRAGAPAGRPTATVQPRVARLHRRSCSTRRACATSSISSGRPPASTSPSKRRSSDRRHGAAATASRSSRR